MLLEGPRSFNSFRLILLKLTLQMLKLVSYIRVCLMKVVMILAKTEA